MPQLSGFLRQVFGPGAAGIYLCCKPRAVRRADCLLCQGRECGGRDSRSGYQDTALGHHSGLAKLYAGNGSNSCSRSSGQEGSRVSTSVSHVFGSRPFIFAVSSRLMICAARAPAASEPAKSQFERPITTGLMARSQRLLSSGSEPSSRKRLSVSRRFSI